MKYYWNLNDPFFNGALATSLDKTNELNHQNYGNYTSEICLNCLFPYQYGIYFRLNSYLVLPFNYLINQLQASGLVNYWESQSMNKKYFNPMPTPKEPKKLNLQQLAGGFIILMAGLFAALFIFILEKITLKIRIFVNTFEWILKS